MYDSQLEDFLKIWIWLDGPEAILLFASEKNPRVHYDSTVTHICQSCVTVHHDSLVRETLSNHYQEKVPEIMFRYFMKRSLQRRMQPSYHAEERLYGAPASVEPEEVVQLEDGEKDLLRLGFARGDIPPDAWDTALALSTLAEDIFNDASVAETFQRNPAVYLRTIGFPDVNLDPNSREVRLILPLAEDKVREAVRNEDAVGFVQALDEIGVFDEVNRELPTELADKIRATLDSTQVAQLDELFLELNLPPQNGAVWTCADVAVWVEAHVVVAIEVAAAAFAVIFALFKAANSPTNSPLPSSLAVALGGPVFATEVQQVEVDQYVEQTIEALLIIEDQTPDLQSMDRAMLERIVRASVEKQVFGMTMPGECRTYLLIIRN